MRSARPYTARGSIRVSRAASGRGRWAVTAGGGDQGVEDERGAAAYGVRVGTGSSTHPASVPNKATSARAHPRPGACIRAAFYRGGRYGARQRLSPRSGGGRL